MLGYGGYLLPYGCAFGVIADMVRRANRESRAAGQARAPPQGREDQVREACRHDCQWFVSDLGLGNGACADISALVHGLCVTMAPNCYQPRRPQIPMPIPSRLACWRPLSTTCRSRSTTFTCATRTTEFLVYVCWARSWCRSLARSFDSLLQQFFAAGITLERYFECVLSCSRSMTHLCATAAGQSRPTPSSRRFSHAIRTS